MQDACVRACMHPIHIHIHIHIHNPYQHRCYVNPSKSPAFHQASPARPQKPARTSTTTPPSSNQASENHLFFTSQAHPSMPSPRLPTSNPSILTPCIPIVSTSHSAPAIPPALALFSGCNSNIGVRNSAILFASSSLKWYFSFNTSGSAQCLNLCMFRSSPFRLKISWLHLPARQRDLGKGPRSSMICAM
jgi:hypothetical protein